MNTPQKLNILVLGGQSSIGRLFLSQVEPNDFNIYATCSNSELLAGEILKHNWYELNLKSQDSIDLFLLNSSAICGSAAMIVTDVKYSDLTISSPSR